MKKAWKSRITDEQLRRHWFAGKPAAWIAAEAGVEESAISHRRKTLGLPARRKPLKSGGRIPRATGVKKRNPGRKAKRFEENFGEYADFIRSLPCDVCGVVGYTEAAHLTSRGAGGKAKDLAPLCGRRVCPIRGVLLTGCHRAYDEFRWTLPEGTEERLRNLAASRWQSHSLNNRKEESE